MCLLQLVTISWSQDVDYFKVDDLGYVYTLSQASLVKHSPKGDTLFVYSRMDLGMPSQLDVSNPLRPLIFFKQTGTMVLLDNTLSEQRVVRLFETGAGLPEWVASGVNQEFWMFDALNKELLRIDERMSVKANSGYLPNLLGRELLIVGLAERHEQVILADANYGLWIFDRFGGIAKRIPINGVLEMRTHASGIFLRTESGPLWYNYGAIEPEIFQNPKASTSKQLFDAQNGKYFYLQAKKLQVQYENAD
ncbi:MAG: hypothetical protein ACJAU0_000575 [Flavobacteriales bacterium]|jgi:hypothetical protein